MVWLLLVIAACRPAGPDSDPSELLAADMAFDAAVQEGGSEAWVQWFAEDGAMVQEGAGEILGRAALREAAAFLDLPGVSLRWVPRRADIAASGDLGWTTGDYVSESVGEDGVVVRGQGVYVSIWRRQADGAWRVVMDLGNPTAGAGT